MFVKVHVIFSPAPRFILAVRFTKSTLEFVVGSTQFRPVREYPVAADSITEYEPGVTLEKIFVFERVASPSSSRENAVKPVPIVVNEKSRALFGTVSLMIVMVPNLAKSILTVSPYTFVITKSPVPHSL